MFMFMGESLQNALVSLVFCILPLIPTYIWWFKTKGKSECGESARRMDRVVFIFANIVCFGFLCVLLLASFHII